jgi:hypothetical protein
VRNEGHYATKNLAIYNTGNNVTASWTSGRYVERDAKICNLYHI